MSRIKGEDYIYAVSRIRAIETRLLDRNGLERMLEAGTVEAALKVLADAGYEYSGTEAADGADYERLLTEERKKLYRLLREIAPHPEVFDLFLQPLDFHNIKVLIKAEFAGMESPGRLLADCGSIEPRKLTSMIRERQLEEMPATMRKAVEEAMEDFHRNRDSQNIDIILDRACYQRMLEMAQATGYAFLIDFVKTMVDLINIRIFLRLKHLKKDGEFIRRAMLPGGISKPENYLELLESPVEELAGLLGDSPYEKLARAAIEDYRATGNLILLEKLSEDFLMARVKRTKYQIDGLEPLVGYLIARETEMRNVRMILVGKSGRLSGDRIRGRLREMYA